MSAGGREMTHLMAKAIAGDTKDKLPAGSKLLDIGFGIGGAAFDFASSNTNVSVHGIDVNPVGLEMAQKALKEINEGLVDDGKPPLDVTFQLVGANEATFAEESFDVIYSRDVLLHLDAEAKQELFQKCIKWLKPGGTICIGDYCLGRNFAKGATPTKSTASFQEYLKTRGYHFWTPAEYGEQLESVGFESINPRDMAFWYCGICQTELDRVLDGGANRDELINSQGEDSVSGLQSTYQNKIQMTLRGDRSYVLLTATREPRFLKLRQEVCDTYTKLNKTGLVLSCDGNVSARADSEHYILTPTGVDIPDLTAHNMVLCDNNGKAVASEKYKPTSEVDLHTLIYQTRPDVGAIVHSHSIYACALACCRIPLPPAHYAVCELICDSSRCLPTKPEESRVNCGAYHTYGTWELATATVAALGKNYACLMANHGAIVVGENLEEALYFAERLERECEIYFKSVQLAKPISLTKEEIQSLHQRDMTYGQSPPAQELGSLSSQTSDDA